MKNSNPAVVNGVFVSSAIVLVKALLPLGQTMGWWNLTDDQTKALVDFLETAIPIAVLWVGTIWVAKKTTPLANPVDEDGVQLTRPDNTPAKAELRAMQKEALKIDKEITRGLE